MNRIINFFPDLELEEASFIDGIIQDYSDEEVKNFAMLYRSRRKDPQMILILALVGIFGVAEYTALLLTKWEWAYCIF